MTHNHLRYVYINYIALALANLVHAKRLGVAIFAIVLNSMVDEQTGSTFTWLNSHLRNHQRQDSNSDCTDSEMVQMRSLRKCQHIVSKRNDRVFLLGTCTQEEANRQMARHVI